MMDTTTIIAILSLGLSSIAIFLTWRNTKELRKESDIKMVNEFQASYGELRARMDTRYRVENWIPDRNNRDEWGPLEDYWFFCYREWQATKGSEHERYASIWDNHIRDGVKAGLSHRPLRYVLATIRKEGSLQDVYAKDFINELIALRGEDFQAEFD